MPKTSSRAITSPAGTADTMEVLAREDVLGHSRPCAATMGTISMLVRLPGRPPTQCLSITSPSPQSMRSPALTTACRQAGLPLELAEICGGLLASVVDDLVAIGRLRRTDFERSKRMERVLAAVDEPQVSALRVAMAASPVNGRACVRHWDAVCDKHERGKMAWLLGIETETAYRYGKKQERRK